MWSVEQGAYILQCLLRCSMSGCGCKAWMSLRQPRRSRPVCAPSPPATPTARAQSPAVNTAPIRTPKRGRPPIQPDPIPRDSLRQPHSIPLLGILGKTTIESSCDARPMRNTRKWRIGPCILALRSHPGRLYACPADICRRIDDRIDDRIAAHGAFPGGARIAAQA